MQLFWPRFYTNVICATLRATCIAHVRAFLNEYKFHLTLRSSGQILLLCIHRDFVYNSNRRTACIQLTTLCIFLSVDDRRGQRDKFSLWWWSHVKNINN